jgi:hypothetical protein
MISKKEDSEELRIADCGLRMIGRIGRIGRMRTAEGSGAEGGRWNK